MTYGTLRKDNWDNPIHFLGLWKWDTEPLSEEERVKVNVLSLGHRSHVLLTAPEGAGQG